MLKKLRVVLAWVFIVGITLLFLDSSGVAKEWLGWMAKIQFLPAVMAINSAIVIALVLLTLVFGRIYCSVICPLGILQDGISFLGTIGKKTPYKYRKELKWLRYGIWAAFVIVFVLGIQWAVALLAPYSAYGRMVESLRHPYLTTAIVAGVTLIVIVALSLKGGRTYCNSICPVGTTLSFFSRFAMFRPVIDTSKCVNCGLCGRKCKAQCIDTKNHKIDYSRCVDCFDCLGNCNAGAIKYKFAWKKNEIGGTEAGNDASRRAFMAGTVMAVGAAALKGVDAVAQEGKKLDGGFAEILPKTPIKRETPITPPGSKSVKDFYRRCTACQLCVAQCPNNVLRPSTDLDHLMQPEMGYEKGFCRPECTSCSKVCPTGAILPISKEQKTQYHIGTASVNPELCLSATGKSHCGKCASMCPTGAIMMVEGDGGNRRPVVAEEVCIGCGACEQYCPVRPISAITVNGKEEHV
ncbi:MAG: 4Fe-4S dicluster domain-containing protein [Bacteroidales bacterium]|nr:4Fe-4S dicluster domain-containing protein [Bacteroidales bacterium]MBP5676732.1 4Fe-4S dicluster domain-containing protein [Bacteroidales bacterium]